MTTDQERLIQCLEIAKNATCPRLHVGAMVVSRDIVISVGYNRSTTLGGSCEDEGCLIENNHCIRTIHAEQVALLGIKQIKQELINDAILYVTHSPCLICLKLIIESGIKQVKHLYDYKPHPIGLELAKKAGVTLEKCEL